MNKINILFVSTLTIFVNFAIGYYHQNKSVYIYTVYIALVTLCVYAYLYVYMYIHIICI